jgi:hypothetical protein
MKSGLRRTLAGAAGAATGWLGSDIVAAYRLTRVRCRSTVPTAQSAPR